MLLDTFCQRKLKFICESTLFGVHSADRTNLSANSAANFLLQAWPENYGEEDKNGGE